MQRRITIFMNSEGHYATLHKSGSFSDKYDIMFTDNIDQAHTIGAAIQLTPHAKQIIRSCVPVPAFLTQKITINTECMLGKEEIE